MEKVLLIVGPTGVGKSKVAISLAKQFDGEIISGDAYQCYKELNIGSAKVTPTQMQGVTHYLVDEVSYKETYNVKLFQSKARTYVEAITKNKKLPIVCGGTGLYIKSLIYDYVFHEEEIDEEYHKELEQLNNEELYAKLIEIDLQGSKELHPNNRKRVMRALMMAHLGHKKSEVLANQKHELLYDVLIIGLTMEREHLYTNINKRVEQMMDQGLQDEVLELVDSEDDFNLQSMQGIGYKEWLGFYRKTMSLEETKQLIQKNTRNFAKRQYTWFRNQMDVEWFDVEQPNYEAKMNEKIRIWLMK